MPTESLLPTPLADERLQGGAPEPELETLPIVGADDDAELEPNVPGRGCSSDGVAWQFS